MAAQFETSQNLPFPVDQKKLAFNKLTDVENAKLTKFVAARNAVVNEIAELKQSNSGNFQADLVNYLHALALEVSIFSFYCKDPDHLQLSRFTKLYSRYYKITADIPNVEEGQLVGYQGSLAYLNVKENLGLDLDSDLLPLCKRFWEIQLPDTDLNVVDLFQTLLTRTSFNKEEFLLLADELKSKFKNGDYASTYLNADELTNFVNRVLLGDVSLLVQNLAGQNVNFLNFTRKSLSTVGFGAGFPLVLGVIVVNALESAVSDLNADYRSFNVASNELTVGLSLQRAARALELLQIAFPSFKQLALDCYYNSLNYLLNKPINSFLSQSQEVYLNGEWLESPLFKEDALTTSLPSTIDSSFISLSQPITKVVPGSVELKLNLVGGVDINNLQVYTYSNNAVTQTEFNLLPDLETIYVPLTKLGKNLIQVRTPELYSNWAEVYNIPDNVVFLENIS